MKKYKIWTLALVWLLAGCDESYIDDIVPVSPGVDTEPPEVVINFPTEGTQIRVTEDVTPLDISFEVTDDIEVETIRLELNGSEIATYSDFLDFRRVIKTHRYEELGNGAHELTITATDLSGKTTTETVNFEKIEPYTPVYDGETFYAPFDGDFMDLVSTQTPEVTGNPGFGDGIMNRAYRGAANAHLVYPTDGLLQDEFSAVFWYHVNGDPDRAGLLTIAPPDEDNPDNQNNRTGGFRLFREAAGPMQRIKLNVGNGEADNWFDGGEAADVDPSANEWVHVAITISQSQAAVYINGEVVSQGDFPGIDWTGSDIMTVGSGAPRFTEWGHLGDASLFDELRLFSRYLNQAEIQAIMAAEMP
ncbi:LamG domain-containing protein [Litoribacter ruber]|uniref:LamG domain-containing protein n=1 Tax=Litoribacter ruber TaxID=702568 RepID=UPI001BD9FDAD|nr:LamG domain-containing protein [Litoribacter ruber]MBT0812412.1 LamG domain-containing protein [Litoribacter ruber]